MNIWILDTIETGALVEPIRANPADFNPAITLASELGPEQVAEGDFALLSAADAALLTQTHLVHPTLGLVSEHTGSSALLTPARPDTIEDTDVAMLNVSGTSELLARALLWPYFGIKTQHWTNGPSATARANIVDGATGLNEPELGMRSDLITAWFVLTSMPVVTHVLAAPRTAERAAIDLVAASLQSALDAGLADARSVRQSIREREDVHPQMLVDFFRNQRANLIPEDHDALRALLFRGSGGSKYAGLPPITFAEPS